jgi:hypothetical protein
MDFLHFLAQSLAQLASPPSFPFPSAASPLADVTIPLHRVTLPSHATKTSSLPPLHPSAMLHPIISPIDPKQKNLIRTTTAGHLTQTA